MGGVVKTRRSRCIVDTLCKKWNTKLTKHYTVVDGHTKVKLGFENVPTQLIVSSAKAPLKHDAETQALQNLVGVLRQFILPTQAITEYIKTGKQEMLDELMSMAGIVLQRMNAELRHDVYAFLTDARRRFLPVHEGEEQRWLKSFRSFMNAMHQEQTDIFKIRRPELFPAAGNAKEKKTGAKAAAAAVEDGGSVEMDEGEEEEGEREGEEEEEEEEEGGDEYEEEEGEEKKEHPLIQLEDDEDEYEIRVVEPQPPNKKVKQLQKILKGEEEEKRKKKGKGTTTGKEKVGIVERKRKRVEKRKEKREEEEEAAAATVVVVEEEQEEVEVVYDKSVKSSNSLSSTNTAKEASSVPAQKATSATSSTTTSKSSSTDSATPSSSKTSSVQWIPLSPTPSAGSLPPPPPPPPRTPQTASTLPNRILPAAPSASPPRKRARVEAVAVGGSTATSSNSSSSGTSTSASSASSSLPLDIEEDLLGVTLHPSAVKGQETVRTWKEKYINAYSKFDDAIWEHYRLNVQDDKVYRWKMEARRKLLEIAQTLYGHAFDVNMFAVGSTVNGCGSYNSDMDLCLVLQPYGGTPEDINEDETLFARKHLQKLFHILKNHRQLVKKSQFIKHAVVPIIKMEVGYPSELEIDININNVAGVYNSHLMHYYSRVDDRFAALCLVVKHWAIKSDINDSLNGTFNSYSLILLVLHYLQCGVTPAVLPNLQYLYPERFAERPPLTKLNLFGDFKPPLPVRYLNNSSVGELLVGFFKYYSSFNWYQTAISIRRGKTFHRSTLPAEAGRFDVYIEEPFDGRNTARCVRSTMMSRIKEAFVEAVDALQNRPPKLADIDVAV